MKMITHIYKNADKLRICLACGCTIIGILTACKSHLILQSDWLVYSNLLFTVGFSLRVTCTKIVIGNVEVMSKSVGLYEFLANFSFLLHCK